MAYAPKIQQLDLFIKEKEEVERVTMEAKKKNYTRRINHLFGELGRIKLELIADGLYDEEKTP